MPDKITNLQQKVDRKKYSDGFDAAFGLCCPEGPKSLLLRLWKLLGKTKK